MKTVDILLGTYNGEHFLPAMLKSLSEQTCQDFRLLARDDGSSDATLRVLESAGAEILRDPPGNLRPCGNFGALLSASRADYVMCADQDDVWLPDKIQSTVDAMHQAEAEFDSHTPILVHTDLKVVDCDLQPPGDSFWRYQHLNPVQGATLPRLLMQNVVTGCTAMANRALCELASPIPPEAIMHDWWLALVASAFGRLVAVPRATILYRQHGANDTGATRFDWGHILHKALTCFDRTALSTSLQRSQAQAAAFLAHYADRLAPERKALVQAYSEIATCGFFEKRLRLVRNGFWKCGLTRNLGLLARI